MPLFYSSRWDRWCLGTNNWGFFWTWICCIIWWYLSLAIQVTYLSLAIQVTSTGIRSVVMWFLCSVAGGSGVTTPSGSLYFVLFFIFDSFLLDNWIPWRSMCTKPPHTYPPTLYRPTPSLPPSNPPQRKELNCACGATSRWCCHALAIHWAYMLCLPFPFPLNCEFRFHILIFLSAYVCMSCDWCVQGMIIRSAPLENTWI